MAFGLKTIGNFITTYSRYSKSAGSKTKEAAKFAERATGSKCSLKAVWGQDVKSASMSSTQASDARAKPFDYGAAMRRAHLANINGQVPTEYKSIGTQTNLPM